MPNEPLSKGRYGQEVKILQEKLLKHGFSIPREELDRGMFGTVTQEAVQKCQKEHGLNSTGVVDLATMAAIDAAISPGHIVDSVPLIPNEPHPTEPPPSSTVKRSLKMIIPPLRRNDQGAEVVNLQDTLLLLIERQVVQLPERVRLLLYGGLKSEQQTQIYNDYTEKLIGLFQQQFSTKFHLTESGEVDSPTADALNNLLKELGALALGQNEEETFTVDGKVLSTTRAGVDRLRVVIVDKNIGGDVPLYETVTESGGSYNATFLIKGLKERCKQRPDLQSRVFKDETTYLGASEVRYNATNRETLNIVLAEQASSALASEYETLTSELTDNCHVSLKDLKETEDQQDITYLANKTGWDARAVALAALADQFSARTLDERNSPTIEPAFFYALFRAGLSANDGAIYQTDASTAEAIWKQAINQGVISSTLESRLPQVCERFQSLAVQRSLDTPALAGVSSLKEMLSVSLGDDSARQQQFATLYTQHRAEPDKLWTAVRETFGESAEKRLRIDGQLSYLTLNNAPLISKLHLTAGQNGLSQPLDLVDQGFYQAEKWSELIGDSVIPPEISGKDDTEKRVNYAELMAAQVRLSFPTAVVAETIKNIEGSNFSIASSFLREHHGKFELGMQPIEQYISRNTLQVTEEVTQTVKQIQRVYQITPSDSAMIGLLKKGIDSAYAVVSYDRDDFIRLFKDEVGGEENALLIYAKSLQVHNAVINIATSYLTAKSATPIGVHSPAQVVAPAPNVPANAGDVIAYPTLESLFGEMDYCACEHCRSILSPAAYLVSLLQFIDLKRYNNQGVELPKTYAGENPLDVLLERRPDIQYLQLTCENTNKPLPYIDLVNETLEYFIFNKLSLEKYEGHNTDNDATAEELMANPQFGNTLASAETYKILAAAHFPPPLHQPLEYLRRYFDRFESPLPEVMEALRESDNLERSNPADPTNPIEYGWRDILMEELRLSRAEHAVLSDGTLTLQQLYGYPTTISEADVLGGYLFSIGLNFIQELNKGEISQSLRQQFEQHGKTLSDICRVELKKAERNWAIVDAFVYDIRNENNTLNVYLVGLSNAKTFTRRMGISYEDIIEILHTRFVNPSTTLVPKLERLYVPFITLKQFKDGTIDDAEFDKLLPQGLDVAQYGGDIKAWVRNEANYANIMSLITLANPAGVEDICSFDKLEFRYSDPGKIDKPISVFEFYRLLRFIRLWKKLGWTIEQTDKTIMALYPADQTPNHTDDAVNLQRLDAGFRMLLPRLGIIKRVMASLKLKPKKDLLPLLACFAPIDTHGSVSLYRQMFLSPALLKQDPILADNGYGSFLTDEKQKLLMHTETLRAAFLLTDDELSQIITALNYDANTPLTMDNVSSVFRRSWLARKLKLSVREFLLLTRFTGFDPFTAPDAPNPSIMCLIEMLNRLRAASLKPVQALYLIWNQDVSGKSAPDDDEVLAFGRTLRTGFASIESEFVVVDDPDGQITRARMALVYDNDITDRFFGLLDEKTVTNVPYSHDKATLEQAILDAGQSKISYDNLRKRLSYTGGVLPDTIRHSLKSVPGVTHAFKNAVDELHTKSRALFDRFLELLPLYNAYLASNELPEKRRSNLLASLLGTLKPRRKRQQALQAISVAAKTDIGFSSALLDNKLYGKYILHATNDVSQPALNDLTAVETPGLSTQFFFRDTATSDVDFTSDAEANLDYSSAAKDKAKMPANGGNAVSGIWSGYLEMPENAFYNFHVETDAEAFVTLTLDGKTIDLVQNGNVRSNKDAVELRAGTLYSISLKVERVKDTLTVRWETEGRGREIIPARYLYSETLNAHLRTTYVRFLKAVSLAEALKLTASETVHFASHSDYRIVDQGWLNNLPVTGDPDNATSTALLKALMALLGFSHIKAEISPDDERLLTVLNNPETIIKNLTAVSAKPELLLISLTRWEPASLDALLVRFGKIKDGKADRTTLKDLDTFSRVYTAYSVMKKLGIPASALIKATTNEPNATIIRDLQSALRARYEENDWLNVLKPINDEMRALQRDALVTYILHQMRANPNSAHIDTPDKLFEYFLMDVQMSPCMQTSRIRHALSSVQLFIERCLMNLEKNKVDPSSIKAKQWEWMKRYRVWEANRKVFLWPENWLEPELRDDQSPFFKETMSELLQSDITEDSAAVALLNYLSKLDEVAKLEPCGIHYVENDVETSDDIAHVVARTSGGNRKYFYRRREGGYWTPWEHIKLDIEDNPVIPVVWKGRLFLFWLRIIKQTPPNTDSQAATPAPKKDPNDPKSREKNFSEMSLSEAKGAAKEDAKRNITLKVQAVLCWSEYYNGKWQPTKTSDVNRPTELGSFPVAGENAFNRSNLWLRVFEDNAGELRIFIRGEGSGSFLLYNTHSLPIQEEDTPIAFGLSGEHQRRLSTENDVLAISYDKFQPGVGMAPDFSHDVLKTQIYGDQTIEPRHSVKSPRDTPFFYEDRHHVFFVSTTEQPLAIPKWIGYIPITFRSKLDLTIPPLVLEKVSVVTDLLGPKISGRNMEVVNTAQIERFVSEDAYIKKSISTAGTILFGGTELGATGNRNTFQKR
ncbi:neuraminidase-like domain-containing protein [Methylobacter sp. BlB1]|uniref:neuraminidase-like domain-containing protein n=1 Tax=Methylobacter sp. BlB1 TaxID=2785914 RepID=UPI0018931B62|nr:neuraminidase-like domain-containing protein [Methylobacter sp. BlB1]MBF6650643.1 peptidoglycan-binding protein [Methylobacter sp. BlB1]